MFNKFGKSILSIGLTAMVLASCTFVGSAAEATFSKKFVDSNQFTYVAAATKATKSSTADVKITEMYKSDGSSSSYQYLYVRASSDGSQKRVKKGQYYEVNLPSSLQERGAWVSLYAKGNNPSLDCKVSGYWVVH